MASFNSRYTYKELGKFLLVDWREPHKPTWDMVKNVVHKELQGKWRPVEKYWLVEATYTNKERLRDLGFMSEVEYQKVREQAIKEKAVEATSEYPPLPVFPDLKGIELNSKRTPKEIRQYQIEAVQFIMSRFEAKANGCIVAYPMGSGKAIWNESTVVTPEGHKKVGEIVVGDFVVCPETGNNVKVIGVYPQPRQMLYKVSFGDGRSTYCTMNHIWRLRDKYNKYNKKTKEPLIYDKPLSYVLEKGLKTSQNESRFSVAFPIPVTFGSFKKLPLDPYMVGYLIGNGSMHNDEKSSMLAISTKDREIVEWFMRKVKDYGPYTLKQVTSNTYDWSIIFEKGLGPQGAGINKGYIKETLTDLGLSGTHSHDKFIPEIYLMASVEDRVSLLQGLIDSDGYIPKKTSSLSYITTSPDLAKDVMYLVRSLGGYASHNVLTKYFTHKGEKKVGRPVHSIQINIPPSVGVPSRLKRKGGGFIPRRATGLTIRSVEPFEEGESTCFLLDSEEHMYMVDDFIPTHNTLLSTSFLSQYEWDKPILIVCPASLKTHWKRELQKWGAIQSQIIYSTFKKSSLRSHTEALICNFEILHKIEDELMGNISAIIVDEADILQNHEGNKRVDAFNRIQALAEFRVFLTGTPTRNNPLNIYNLLKWSDPIYWKNLVDFKKRYTEVGMGFGERLTVTKSKNLDELHVRVKPWLTYKSMEEILPELPKMNNTIYQLKPDDSIQTLSDEIDRILEENGWDMEDILEGILDTKDAKVVALLSRIEELSRSSYSVKRPTIHDQVKEFIKEGEPFVLVAFHQSVIDDLKLTFDFESIDGRINPAHRQAIVDRFNNGDKQGIILQTQAGGVGFSMPNCRRMLFVETNYSARDTSQMAARIRRLTSSVGDNVFYYFYVFRDTIDEKQIKAISKKSKIGSMIVAGEEQDFFASAVTNYEELD